LERDISCKEARTGWEKMKRKGNADGEDIDEGEYMLHKCAIMLDGKWMDLGFTGYHYAFAYTSSPSAGCLRMTHLRLRIERSRDLLI